MQRVSICPGGPTFSRMVFGTWKLTDSKANPTPQGINRLLHACLENGITTLDTAEIYGLYEAERLLGEAFALSPGLAKKFEIVTKAGIYVPCKYHPDRHTAHYNATGARLVKSLDKSLRLMGVERVNLFLMHRPDWFTRADDTADGLSKIIASGKSQAVGVSNYSAAQFDLLASRLPSPPATNQIEFHLLRCDPIHDGTLAQCEKHNIRPMAWSPLAGGRIFDPKHEAATRLSAAAARLELKYGAATLEQLAYAWVMAHPSGPLAIIGTTKLERIQSAAKADGITLEREDWYALWEAANGRRIP